jgi:hypothetical protein
MRPEHDSRAARAGETNGEPVSADVDVAHVSAILRKLCGRHRGEAAAAATRLGLLA